VASALVVPSALTVASVGSRTDASRPGVGSGSLGQPDVIRRSAAEAAARARMNPLYRELGRFDVVIAWGAVALVT